MSNFLLFGPFPHLLTYVIKFTQSRLFHLHPAPTSYIWVCFLINFTDVNILSRPRSWSPAAIVRRLPPRRRLRAEGKERVIELRGTFQRGQVVYVDRGAIWLYIFPMLSHLFFGPFEAPSMRTRRCCACDWLTHLTQIWAIFVTCYTNLLMIWNMGRRKVYVCFWKNKFKVERWSCTYHNYHDKHVTEGSVLAKM